MDKVKPAEIGLPFKEVPFIFVGHCGSTDGVHSRNDAFLDNLAHTHNCPNDIYRKCICVREKSFLELNFIMWHEYAHVLTKNPYIIIDCGEKEIDHIISFNSYRDLENYNGGHNKEWADIYRGFGFDPTQVIKAASWEWKKISKTSFSVTKTGRRKLLSWL